MCLCKLQNIFIFVANSIGQNCKLYLSKVQIVFVRITHCGWRTIWHRSQFDTGVNLAPRVLGGQFGTKSVKESIWHRYQFGTKSVKESIWHRSQFGTGPIWHQECKRGQFGTGTNLAPGPIWHHTKGKI